MKRTKIVATVGPASGSREKLQALAAAGVDVFRINFSHGDEEQRGEFLENIRAVEKEVGRPIAICGDLCGPKIRVGMIDGGEAHLTAGREIVIQRAEIEGTEERISTTLAELIDVVREGQRILLADGRLRFEILRTSPPDEFTCRIVVGGALSSGKGVNIPDTDLPISALTEKDRDDIRWIAARDFDYVALSFVQRPEDLDELRDLLQRHGSDARIIAKIEKPRAIDHIDSIIERTDAVMVARGDLGVEMDFPSVPIAQKMIARKCEAAGKPCIIATEMLESMVRSPTPTRAEVSDVANAVFDHADAVMLSAESSIGAHPIKTVDAMRRVVIAAEEFLDEYGDHGPRGAEAVTSRKSGMTAALAASIHNLMELQTISAIAVYTSDGTAARVVSKTRLACPILTLASEPAVARRACLYYGAVPRLVEPLYDVQQLLRRSDEIIKDLGIASSGARFVVLASRPLGTPGHTRGLIVDRVT